MMPTGRSASAIASCLLIFFGAWWFLRQDLDLPLRTLHFEHAAEKPAKHHRKPFHAPSANVWSELTPSEAQSIYDFAAGYPELKIEWLETLRPNKSDVFQGTTQRWAKVLASETVNDIPYLSYYSIGPLPVSNATKVEPLDWMFHGKSHGIKRPVATYENMLAAGLKIAMNVTDITKDLVGDHVRSLDPFDKKGLRLNVRATFMDEGYAYLWMGLLKRGPRSSAWSILPQGLFFKIKATSEPHESYDVLQWYYNGEYYDTADDLRVAMKSPHFIRAATNENGDWTTIEDVEENEERDGPPPVMVQPYGPRYKYDPEEQYVSYMGWTFYFTSYMATGPTLYDVRFQNESVLYELGLNEALAHYAGDDPVQGGREFLDAAFGMGKYAFELVPGYDCPAYADYVDVTYHIDGKPWHNKGSICIFEYTADSLLQRHTSGNQVTVSKNTYLIVRYVSTVGNYDYTIEYAFYLDGTLEVKVRASGFIFGAYRSNTTNNSPHDPPGANADQYGYHIHDALSSSMHDHIISFRADVDIAGRENTFSTVSIEPTTRSYPWEQPEVPVRNTMHLSTTPLLSETGLNYAPNSAAMFLISSPELNQWGEPRSYRITPGTGMGTPPRLTIHESQSLGASARWAEKDLWVLRQKDTERACADPTNFFSPLEPLLRFDRSADAEPLDQAGEDLVLYFNLGAHHVPHSGDLPNTLMHTSSSGVAFVPHNFLGRDASRRTSTGVRVGLKGGNGAIGLGKQHGGVYGLDKQEGEVTGLEYFGGRYEGSMRLGVEELEPALKGYGAGRMGEAQLDLDKTIFGSG